MLIKHFVASQFIEYREKIKNLEDQVQQQHVSNMSEYVCVSYVHIHFEKSRLPQLLFLPEHYYDISISIKEFLNCCSDSVFINWEKFYFMIKCDNGL